MKLTKEQALELAQTNTLELDNGKTLRFRMSPDDTRINDWDCYGKVVHIWKGDDARPQDFDGMAEKIHTPFDSYWWQPPQDLRSGWHNYENKNKFRQTIVDILTFGFDNYWIELCDGENAYGEPVVQDYTVCGGFEPLQNDDDVADTLMDMAYELTVEETVEKG